MMVGAVRAWHAPSPKAARAHRVGRPRRSPGYTLVELLMVVAIIGLLMALLLPAIQRARLSARRARVQMEIEQLSQALTQYRNKYGEYPPNYFGQSEGSHGANYGDMVVARHFRKRFPSLGAFGQNWVAVKTEVLTRTGRNIEFMTPAEALVFWLGGFSNNDFEMTGFNLNPQTPFTPGGQREAPLFDFDASRLRDPDGNGFPEYYPPGADLKTPYVYFNALPSGEYVRYFGISSATGVAWPYKTDAGAYVNPDSFQIVWSGFDYHYGANNGDKRFPGNSNGKYAAGDLDNQTNFAPGILEDAIP